MTEAIASIQALTPLGAVIVLAGVLSSVLTQVLKRPGMTSARRQIVSVTSAVLLGMVAYVVVLGTTAGLPATAVEAISTGVVIVAGVALMSRAAYALIGRAIPDGGPSETSVEEDESPAHGRRADRDGVRDGQDTPQ